MDVKAFVSVEPLFYFLMLMSRIIISDDVNVSGFRDISIDQV